jgi:ankyrin repeat protein
MRGFRPTTADLIALIHKDDVDGILQLVSAGAPLNDVDEDGWTPLIHAIRHSELAVVETLLQLGADPTIEDDFGWSSFAHAADCADPAIIAFMRQRRLQSAA